MCEHTLVQWHDVKFEHYLEQILDIGPPPPPGELDRIFVETVTELYGGGGTNTPQRVQWLINAGANVNAEVDGDPILLRATFSRCATQLVLLNAGADWQRISEEMAGIVY